VYSVHVYTSPGQEMATEIMFVVAYVYLFVTSFVVNASGKTVTAVVNLVH